MIEVTYDSMPGAIQEIREEIHGLKLMFQNHISIEPDQWFDTDEICEYLPGKPKKTTVYRKVWSGDIPAHRFGKRLAFLKSEIDQWLKEKHRITNKEIQVEDFLKVKK